MKRTLPIVSLILILICSLGPMTLSAAENTVTKTADEKFIHMSTIALNMDFNKDIHHLTVYPRSADKNKSLDDLIKDADAKRIQDEKDAEKRLKKSDNNKEKLKEDDGAVKYDDTKFSDNAYKTLKSIGFIDTVNRVFQDENNTVVLQGKINKIDIIRIYDKKDNNSERAKVTMQWYVKNRYGEILDSMDTKDMSGEFDILTTYAYGVMYPSEQEVKHRVKMVGDAVDTTVIKLLSNSAFKKHLKSEPVPPFTGDLLHINKPKAVVADKGDAAAASVIIKRDDQGHGSGFAISQDGYILTNYHVIATKNPDKTEKIKVLTSSGEELEPTIVRFNKAADIVLLKVDKKFDKAFILSPDKSFKNLQDVYTIGAPKSVELGQTVSTGIISNERKSNNNDLLQLSMPVNSGNSGGPLFDATGTLHGVIVAKLIGESTEGIAFAIPAYRIPEYIKINY